MIFHKLSVLGNDFILIINQSIDESEIPMLCDNHEGIGGDGVLLYEEDSRILKIFNKDGSRAKMCGNGLKALAHYLKKTKGMEKHTVFVGNEEIEIGSKDNNSYVKLPLARFKKKLGKHYLYDVKNKHALSIEKTIDEDTLISEAKDLIGYNVSQVRLISNFEAEILTFENGVGFTRSCGSASIATFTLLHHLNLIKDHLLLYSPGGMTYLRKDNEGVINSSPVIYVYKGVRR